MTFTIFVKFIGLSLLLANPNSFNSHPTTPLDPYLAQEVKNTIRKKSADIKMCYTEFLTTHPKKLEGKLNVDWQIDKSGKVLQPELIDSSLENQKLADCVLKKIAKWHFPAPPNEKTKYVAHQFNFKQEK